MTERFDGKDPSVEIFTIVKELESSGAEVKPGLVLQAIVGKYFDFDASDFREDIAKLMAYQIIVLSFSGNVRLVGTLHQLNDPRFLVID